MTLNNRVVQHCLCDNILKPYFENRLIYDNAACREGKGTDFARYRLTVFLREHYKKHGTNGYILNVNDNGNNVKNTLGVRPALPGSQKCMEGSMDQCIGQRNPVPFLRRHLREKHMLSETLDSNAFGTLGMGKAPFPRQPLEENK